MDGGGEETVGVVALRGERRWRQGKRGEKKGQGLSQHKSKRGEKGRDIDHPTAASTRGAEVAFACIE